ncbi:aminotransferase-like domain-containing protein [Paraglaciecola arctica]|uniref:Transcriptional regulator, GntR family with aminotransferase domain protein n=1 Tax=Paraglaciecola arctica BSs20135 TaxID=493475 RepID=K6Y0N1_9ALTE|nr:PLP-dependent aminotransferase family protein [Paraglaciecola arctica]GAC17471.1 transcriptional regulator, GntR family with aminotransferase domain protein [Paraglaciecola arctica BSs20135]
MLATRLKHQIEEKYWIVGERLPSIRVLCVTYGHSKNTVIKALHILESENVIEARARSGFYVSLQAANIAPTHQKIKFLRPIKVNVPEIFQDIMDRSAAFDILPNEPLAPPSSSLITLHRHINNAMRFQANKKAMYYDEPQGSLVLRNQLQDDYRHNGLSLSSEEYCITSGCQQSLFLALMVTCQPGDNVAVESPGFYGVLQLLQQLQLNAIEIPSSPTTGVDIDIFESALKKWNIKALVVTPAFATPTGATMPTEHKKNLISLANQYDIALIEDDIYADLGFMERPFPLKSLDTENRVILCSSFSKSLSRDIRVGWIIGGRWQKDIVKLKLVTSLANSQATQIGLASFLKNGHYKRHINQKRLILKQQRDQLITNIQRYWSNSVHFSIPNGGLALWIKLDSKINTQTLYYQALERKIILTPGSLFSVEDRFHNFIRLSFNHPSIGNRKNALKILSNLCVDR